MMMMIVCVSCRQVFLGQQLQAVPGDGHAVRGLGIGPGRHVVRGVRIRTGRFRVRGDGRLAQREQQRDDGLQPVCVLRHQIVRRFHGHAHRDVRPDYVQAEGGRRDVRGRLRSDCRAVRPSQGPGDNHFDQHCGQIAEHAGHVAHTDHVGHARLSADQRLLHVRQTDRDRRQTENARDQHVAVQTGGQSRHVRHL